MKIEVRILLLTVLTAILVCHHCIDCRPTWKAETQIPVNNTASPVHKRYACDRECTFDVAPMCGRTFVVTTPVKREISDLEDSSNNDEEDDRHSDKILGGTFTTYGEIPWMATLLYNRVTVCGGSIISEFWVIASAHCFFDRYTRDFRIAVGDHQLWHQDDFEINFFVQQVILHKNYRPKEGGFDIALVKVKAKKTGRGIIFNNYVQPICLAYELERPEVGTVMLTAGWGYASGNIDYGQSTILKKTYLPVVSMDTCRTLYANRIKAAENVFCAGYVHGDTNLCQGDSGGGAASKLGDIFILYGIAEAGSSGCRAPNYPVLFESVPKLRSWIDATIRLNSNGSERVMPVRQLYVDFVPLPDNLPDY